MHSIEGYCSRRSVEQLEYILRVHFTGETVFPLPMIWVVCAELAGRQSPPSDAGMIYRHYSEIYRQEAPAKSP